MALTAEAAIVCDRSASLVMRLKALATIVERVSVEELEMPASIAEALDDATLIGASVAMKQTTAVCAALHLLGPRPELASTRKLVVTKLIAAGAAGLELATLAFSIGEHKAGASLAARDYAEHIAPRLAATKHDPVAGAWLGWLASQPDAIAAAVLRQLSSRGVRMEALYAHAANPAHVERVRAVVRSILAS